MVDEFQSGEGGKLHGQVLRVASRVSAEFLALKHWLSKRDGSRRPRRAGTRRLLLTNARKRIEPASCSPGQQRPGPGSRSSCEGSVPPEEAFNSYPQVSNELCLDCRASSHWRNLLAQGQMSTRAPGGRDQSPGPGHGHLIWLVINCYLSSNHQDPCLRASSTGHEGA